MLSKGYPRMHHGFRERLAELAKDRPLHLLTLFAAVVATAAAASPLPQSTAARARLITAVERAVVGVAEAAPAEPAPLRLVWDGVDLDGDGRADFANPTGQSARGEDAYGEGQFGARRDGGLRRHEGVDFRADAGQTVTAPISGYITKIGYAYSGDQTLKFVEITNPALRFEARVFYVNPKVEVGDTVAVGHPIGTAHSLQRRYPGGMTNHVHLELIDTAGRHIDAAKVIAAEYVADRAAAD